VPVFDLLAILQRAIATSAECTYLERLLDHLKHTLTASWRTHLASKLRSARPRPRTTWHEDIPETHARHAHAVVEGKLRDDHGGVSIERQTFSLPHVGTSLLFVHALSPWCRAKGEVSGPGHRDGGASAAQRSRRHPLR
jgi:hypothetical protein